MSRCRMVKNPSGWPRILIPGCMGVAANYAVKNAMDYCTCEALYGQEDTPESTNQKIDRLCELVETLVKTIKGGNV